VSDVPGGAAVVGGGGRGSSISGLFRIAEGVKAAAQRAASSSRTLLC
jgi:hypothetical protein